MAGAIQAEAGKWRPRRVARLRRRPRGAAPARGRGRAAGPVTEDAFVAGYGAAQAVPGPLFTFAAYLGAEMLPEPDGFAAAPLALVPIFLRGLLLLVGMLPFRDALRTRPLAQVAMRGTNAAVVGILAAALYEPVWTSAIRGLPDFALAATAFVLLTVWKAPPWTVVAGSTRGAVMMLTSSPVAPKP